jgi:hypothetical protein
MEINDLKGTFSKLSRPTHHLEDFNAPLRVFMYILQTIALTQLQMSYSGKCMSFIISLLFEL